MKHDTPKKVVYHQKGKNVTKKVTIIWQTRDTLIFLMTAGRVRSMIPSVPSSVGLANGTTLVNLKCKGRIVSRVVI
jgi:hypothetical protein